MDTFCVLKKLMITTDPAGSRLSMKQYYTILISPENKLAMMYMPCGEEVMT